MTTRKISSLYIKNTLLIPSQGVQRRWGFVVIFYVFANSVFVVAICDLARDVENILHLCLLLKTSGNLL